MPKPWRRLELRLPADHAVWDLPEGSRARIVREWLEVGSRLTGIEESLQTVIDALHKNTNNICNGTEDKSPENQSDADTGFDKNAFLNYFK